ncbi:hypothetical protein BN8_06525 [Fibrisoma limi BUZ 3]|uniref:Uncharacterized protein n=1 Tax=Fibrisoma limi BUZ 3 TaxID=1185876 RepID=I2GT92_9BACT|nr:hypothetical protein [Fibrisoma limi]CCH57121.1 hypothetical protein BN8_06525 [Fibrisoma limi BUZ 3]
MNNQLTAYDLANYISCKAKVTTDEYGPVTAYLSGVYIDPADTNKSTIFITFDSPVNGMWSDWVETHQVIPILMPLSALSVPDGLTLVEIACNRSFNPATTICHISIERTKTASGYHDTGVLITVIDVLDYTIRLFIGFDQHMRCQREMEDFPIANILAIWNYLTHRCYDVQGWIQLGLAYNGVYVPEQGND